MRSPGCARGRRTLLGELPPRALRYSGMTPASRQWARMLPQPGCAGLPPGHLRTARDAPDCPAMGPSTQADGPQTPLKGSQIPCYTDSTVFSSFGGRLALSPCAAPQVAAPRSDPGRIG